MRLLLINDDGSKTEVDVITLNGNKTLIIVDETDEVKAVSIAQLSNYEIGFSSSYMVVYGYIRRDDDMFELKSFHFTTTEK